MFLFCLHDLVEVANNNLFLVAIDLFLLGFACIKVRFLTIFWKMFYM